MWRLASSAQLEVRDLGLECLVFPRRAAEQRLELLLVARGPGELRREPLFGLDGFRELHPRVVQQLLVLVEWLMTTKSRISNKSAQNGTTALMIASQQGHVEVVRLLLARQGVEVNKTEQNGATALEGLCCVGSMQPVKALCNRTRGRDGGAACNPCNPLRHEREPARWATGCRAHNIA